MDELVELLARANCRPATQVVLKDHAIVPREPTEAMVQAGIRIGGDYPVGTFLAMIQAGEIKL